MRRKKSRDPIHIRVWSNNPRDLDTMCGLFLKERDWWYAHGPEGATCEDCIRKWHEVNPAYKEHEIELV